MQGKTIQICFQKDNQTIHKFHEIQKLLHTSFRESGKTT